MFLNIGVPFRMLNRFNEMTTRAFCAAAGICLAVMTLIVLLQVFCRYVLNAPLSWPEEAARYLMVWMTFLVAPFAYREGLLIRLETLTRRLAAPIQRGIEIGTHFLIAITLMILLRESLWIVERGSRIHSSALNIPMSVVFAIMPVSFILLLSVGCELIRSAFSTPGDSREQAADAGETS